MARSSAARSVNGVMNAAYWLIGRQVVAYRHSRGEYGSDLAETLSEHLKRRLGSGFGTASLSELREFYLQWPYERSRQGDSRGSSSMDDPAFLARVEKRVRGQDGPEATVESLADLAARFPLPWSAYLRLLSVEDRSAREFYENQAIRGGWSVRQLDRQIISLLYDRTAPSGDATGVLTGGSPSRAEVEVAPEHTVKDPSVLAFLDLDGENSDSDERGWDRPSLKEVYSIGDWICLDYRFGRVVAVRDSEIDVDYGHSTATLRSDADLSNIEKVHGPESETPGESSTVHPDSPRCADVFVSLDGRHGKHSGKRGWLTGGHSLVDFVDGGGKYYEVKFPGSPRLLLIDEECVYGRCRKAPEHFDRWLLKSR